MKICFLINDMNPKAGWGRYANDLISAVRGAGHEVVILKAEDDGFDGLPVLRGNLFLLSLKVRKYLAHCDIIHALDGYPYGIIATLANLGLNKKLVITIQGTYSVAPLYNFVTGPMLKWAYKKADKIISISQYTKKEILEKIDLRDIEVINHGIDFEKFHKLSEDSKEKFILGVGALKYRKGYHISIPAFAEAKKEFPDLKYKIVGSQKDAKYFDKLKDLVREYGIENDVEFLTGLSDESLSDLYRRAKIFVLTSVNENHHFEGFGLVFLEAAAAGLPVIGTLNNGIEDAVKDNYNGILVPQNDIEKTAKAIADIIKNENLRKKMSLNSIAWAKNHDWEKVVVKYIKAYTGENK
jgi:glycosyltransferase involved in cell wall biosynthesis